MLRDIDAAAVEAALRDVAAEHIMPLFRNLSAEQVRTKSSAEDFVTDADVAAERALWARLAPLWPGAGLIGEESVAADPSRLQALSREGAFWIVDPIDGTRNFVRGDERFATMIALVVDGDIRWSWIYAPVWDVCATAQAGAGAWIGDRRLRGRRSDPATIQTWRGEYNRKWIPADQRPALDAGAARLGEPYDWASAAHGYLALARGEADFSIYGKIAPWDHAPGALLAEEAGGRCAFLDSGAPYRPRVWPDRALVTTADADAWPALQAILTGAD